MPLITCPAWLDQKLAPEMTHMKAIASICLSVRSNQVELNTALYITAHSEIKFRPPGPKGAVNTTTEQSTLRQIQQ